MSRSPDRRKMDRFGGGIGGSRPKSARGERCAMPRIDWVEDADAGEDLAKIFASLRAARNGRVPEIMRTLSHRPDFLKSIWDAAQQLHFADGALTRAQHEMIASYVSALNRCRY